jgi:hypothetical protein
MSQNKMKLTKLQPSPAARLDHGVRTAKTRSARPVKTTPLSAQ